MGTQSESAPRTAGTHKPTGMDVVRNSGSRGDKVSLRPYGPPRAPSARAAAPRVNPNAPIASVNRAIGDVSRTRSSARRIAGDLLRVPQTMMYGAEAAMPTPDFRKLPAPRVGSVPAMRGTRSVANRGQSYAARANEQYGAMSPGEKGALRRRTNKAAAAAKPIMQAGLSARYGEAPTPPKPKTARKPRKPKEPKPPAATTVDVQPKAPSKPKAPKAPKTPKPPAATTVEVQPKETPFKTVEIPKETTVEFKRSFQPGSLPGETRAQTKARHKAEYAADKAAEREAKKAAGSKKPESKKVTPKNTTKAPPSAKPPSPPAADAEPMSVTAARSDGPSPPAKMLYDNRGQMLAENANIRAAAAAKRTEKLLSAMEPNARRKAKRLFKSIENKENYAAKRAARKGMKARYGAGAAGVTPERISATTSKPRLTAEERKAAKEAKRAENRRIHAENQAREREARKAAKAAGGSVKAKPHAPIGPFKLESYNPNSPLMLYKDTPKPVKASKSSGFVSNYKPVERTFDPMTARSGTLRLAESPDAVRYGMQARTRRRMYGKEGPGTGPWQITPPEQATQKMFPGMPGKPATGQPHMQGKGARVIGEQGNFRVWQGNKRSEIVLQHRSGRQFNLPYNPNKQGPVNPKGILDYANRGKNEKAFLKGGNSSPSKQGARSRIGRFLIGASKGGGILSVGGVAAYGIGKLLGPAGTFIGPADAAAAPGTPGHYYAKQAAKTPNRAARHALQRKAVEASRYRQGNTRPFIEPSQYKAITKKYGPSPFGNYADVVSTSGAYAKRFPNKRYKGKK